MTVTDRSALRASRIVPNGGYRFIPSVFQFSGGVAAEPGYRFERVVLRNPMPLADGFDFVARRLSDLDRPTTAVCAFELRSPGQFTESDFTSFNRQYAGVLNEWGLMDGDVNPVARTNVCPAAPKPHVPSIQAFVYTVAAEDAGGVDFVTAGGAETPEGDSDYRGGIVRLGDTSLDGLREKLAFVRDEQTIRLRSLRHDWESASEVNVYCLHDVGPLLYDELITKGASAPHEGLTVFKASPPVADCDLEMDVRNISSTLAVDGIS
jgi:hypothetical protein